MPATHTHGIAPAYRRRTPETEPLYQVIAEHVETFIERTRSSDRINNCDFWTILDGHFQHLIRPTCQWNPKCSEELECSRHPPKEEAPEADPCARAEPTPAQRRHRLAWADLLRRVFRIDVTVCPPVAVT